MSFAAKEQQRSAGSAGDNVDAITNTMVSAALQADVGGGQKASIYGSYHSNIVRQANLTLSSHQLSKIPQDIKNDLQKQANSRIYNNLGTASSQFRSELEKLALLLYVKAKNPNVDIEHALKMQRSFLERAVESWKHYANLDEVFKSEHHRYSGSTELLPSMLKAVEGAMRQSLKDQKIGPDARVEICG